MRRLLAVGAVAALGAHAFRRRAKGASATVVVGLDDGSAIALDRASPARDRLLTLARIALAR